MLRLPLRLWAGGYEFLERLIGRVSFRMTRDQQLDAPWKETLKLCY